MREAVDDGRGALWILRTIMQARVSPALYTELTSLQKMSSESVTDYVIRTETSITVLHNAGEVLSDGLLVAMILKGLPESFKQFSIFITQGDETLPFAEFKTKLRCYESTESMRTAAADDNVMGVRAHPKRAASAGASARSTLCVSVVARDCQSGQQRYSQGESTGTARRMATAGQRARSVRGD